MEIYNSALYVDENNKKIIISAERINRLMQTDDSLYAKKLKGHLFCPDCEVVPFSVHKSQGEKTYYLYRYANSKHPPNCIRSFEYVGKNSFERFVNSPEGRRYLKIRLNRIIDTLDGNAVDPKLVLLITAKNWNCLAQDNLENDPVEGKVIQQLPIKHITAPLTHFDYDHYIIYYGIVDLIIRSYDGLSCIDLFRKDDEQPFCSLSTSHGIVAQIRDEYDLKPNLRYYNMRIACITKMKRDHLRGVGGEIAFTSNLALKGR